MTVHTTLADPRILVCDDTPAKRYVLASWLRRAGYEVVECDTAASAAALVREGGFDLAVLDVHLPDGSGVDVTRQIRAHPPLAATPVVHVSAVAIDASDHANALDHGADAYLVDPIEPEVFLSTVRTLLRSHGARRQAERLATRLARLNRAAVRLNVAASVPRLVEAVARAAADVFDGPAVAVLVDEQGEAWRAGAARGDRPEKATPVPEQKAAGLLDLPGPGAGDLGTIPAWADQLPAAGGTWTGFPIVVDGRTDGMVGVQIADDGEDAGRTKLLLTRLAQATAVAMDHIHALAYEHRTAVALQRSLLPQALPEPRGLCLAARYLASQHGMEIGGDFYDAFEIDNRCFLVIGDVQGHSLDAAMVMAELRYSLRAYAFDGHSPAGVVRRLDSLLVRSESDLIATVCVATVSPDRRRLSVVTAGHPAPILVRSGVGRQLPVTGTLLGAGVADHEAMSFDLEPGDRLALFTDGVVERRDGDIQDNIDRLAVDAAAAGGDCEQVADALIRDWGDSEDDVALLVVDLI